jgi:hypothetical protein
MTSYPLCVENGIYDRCNVSLQVAKSIKEFIKKKDRCNDDITRSALQV